MPFKRFQSLLSVLLFVILNGLLTVVCTLSFSSCTQQSEEGASKTEKVVIAAASFSEESLQEMLITASEGDVITLGEGIFNFSRSLSLDGIDNITLKGAGADKTILSFSEQTDGAEGLKITANGFVVEDLGIVDAKGDAIKVQNSEGLIIRNVRVKWSGGPNPQNGAYGLYPVTCKNVLIENCEVSDASDAGIYVGQSENIIVRNNLVHENVAGIEIENSMYAEVYENTCKNNTGGILVFDLPELPVTNGHSIQVYNNLIEDNNHPNFAPEGNIVGIVPAGSGVLVMATKNVHIRDNTIKNHKSFSTAVVSYLINKRPYEDETYNPFCNSISIHNNIISNEENAPDMTRELGQLIYKLFEGNTPQLIIDGIFNPGEETKYCFYENGTIQFANIDAANNFQSPSTDASSFDCTIDSPAKVEL
ncbi:MAG: parallel beta-helix repeat protein [Limisphaerales bacterium]|jgi:parallel beta-helix repeat protein